MTPQPDFYPYSEKPLIENMGFLASHDPVAIDKATFDIIQEEGRCDLAYTSDIDFAAVLKEAERLEIGTTGYTLKRLS